MTSSKKNAIFIVANTSVGQRGNVGFRYQFILRELDCHASLVPKIKLFRNTSFFKFVGYEQFARLLSAIRHCLWSRFPSRLVDNFIFDLCCALRILVTKKGGGCGNILFLGDPLLMTAICARRQGLKVIIDMPIACMFHGRAVLGDRLKGGFSFLEKVMAKLEKKTLALADVVICPSTFVERGLITYLGLSTKVKLSVIPFGVDSQHFLNLGTTEALRVKLYPGRRSRFVYGFVGFAGFRKGFDLLLEVFSRDHYAQDLLVVCGRVDPSLKKIVDQMHNVLTIGFVDPREYFCSFDVFVFPSFCEGSAKVTYEAMAAGNVVVASENSGSVVTNLYDGIVLENLTEESIDKALTDICADELLASKLRRNAIATAKKFTWKSYSEKVLNEIETTSQC